MIMRVCEDGDMMQLADLILICFGLRPAEVLK